MATLHRASVAILSLFILTSCSVNENGSPPEPTDTPAPLARPRQPTPQSTSPDAGRMSDTSNPDTEIPPPAPDAEPSSDTSNPDVGRASDTSKSDVGGTSDTSNPDAGRASDTSNPDTGRANDTSNPDASRASDTSNPDAGRTSDTSNPDTGRASDTSNPDTKVPPPDTRTADTPEKLTTGKSCQTTNECASGLYCAGLVLPTCQPRFNINVTCVNNDQCLSNYCNNGRCEKCAGLVCDT